MPRQLFIADWMDVLFMHFRVDPAALQCDVPLDLDLFDGNAYVSLVAFTQKRLRPSLPFASLLTAPLANHEFFNVRTYVRGPDGPPAIFFLAEWIPNRLAALIGPRMYGLPYRLGRLRYQNNWHVSPLRGTIAAAGRRIKYRAHLLPLPCRERVGVRVEAPDTFAHDRFQPAAPGTLDHFLLERYIAYTHREGIIRRFDVAHEPWPQTRAIVALDESTLLSLSGNWSHDAQLIAANYSPGVHNVAISAPSPVAAPPRRSTSTPPTASPSPVAAPAPRTR